MTRQLQIFVADHCPNCAVARGLARWIAGRYPDLAVSVVDIDDPRAEVPECVFATPTFLLDGRLVSLGNPRPAEVVAWLGAAK